MNVHAHYLFIEDQTQEIKIYKHICKASTVRQFSQIYSIG